MPAPWDERPEPPPNPERWTALAIVVGVATLFVAPLVIDGSPFDKIPPPMAVKVDSPSKITQQSEPNPGPLPPSADEMLIPLGYVGDDDELVPLDSWTEEFADKPDRCHEIANMVNVGVPSDVIRKTLRDASTAEEKCLEEAFFKRELRKEIDETIEGMMWGSAERRRALRELCDQAAVNAEQLIELGTPIPFDYTSCLRDDAYPEAWLDAYTDAVRRSLRD